MTLNQRTYTVKISRIELCDLLLACTTISDETNAAKKWNDLHDKLMKQLDDQDAKNGYGVFEQ